MKRNSSNLGNHELIGLSAKVVGASDPVHAGREGTIIDETHHTITLEESHGHERRLGKRGIILSVDLNGTHVTLDCSRIDYRPEDRTKKARRWKTHEQQKTIAN